MSVGDPDLRFAAKLQIADQLGKQEFDLHCDGTSHSNKKCVGMQVALKNKRTLCIGFDPAQTLLDLAKNKLTEFAVLNSPQDSAKELERMLGNVVGFMSDRANTMKCVGRLLNKHSTSEGDPDPISALQCTLLAGGFDCCRKRVGASYKGHVLCSQKAYTTTRHAAGRRCSSP